MLCLITSITDSLLEFVKDDPVRPEIPREFRVNSNRLVAALVEDHAPKSMVCISLHDFVPEKVEDLEHTSSDPTTIVFYSIWSYKAGAGRDLLQQVLPELKKIYPGATTFITLSPRTEMARRFHLKNGAAVFRENPDTVNYQYNSI
jgi:hypothetical protein